MGWRFGYQDTTTIHPLALVAIIILGTAILFIQSRYVPLAMLIVASFISSAQRIAIFGLDLQILRILIVFTWTRIFLKGEQASFRWHKIDVVFCAWVICKSILYIALRGGGVIENRAGYIFQMFGFYFAFRILIRSLDDVKTFARCVAVISVPVMVAFVIENRTGRNMFSFLGGVPEFTMIREGRLRCQGAFPHAIMAGCFWGGLIPFMAALWFYGGRDKFLAVVGATCSLIVVVTCASSTPVFGVAAGMLAVFLWPLRRHLRKVRLVTIFSIVSLHLVMKSSVWNLIGRISAVGGSTGWHRVGLISNAIKHFWDWAFIGIKSTSYWGWGQQDVTNQYILEGVRGGFLSIVLFVWFLWLCFKGTGALRQKLENTPDEKLVWAIGVALFMHCAMFVAVSYFGQISFLLNMQFAIMASLTPLATNDSLEFGTGQMQEITDHSIKEDNSSWHISQSNSETQSWHS